MNGTPVQFTRQGSTVNIPVSFAGDRFRHSEQVGTYDPAFAGGTFSASFRIPARIFEQLSQRRKAWPIDWTEAGRKTTWLVPERLLLYIQVAEPNDTMSVSLMLDGKAAVLQKAYSSVRKFGRCFTGWYVDISKLPPDADHRLVLVLPSLKPGQFQGVFFENLESETTDRTVASSPTSSRTGP